MRAREIQLGWETEAGIHGEVTGTWQQSRQAVFPGHERLAAPNWDYPPPLGSPSNELKERCG